MRPRLNIAFVRFWKNFDRTNNIFYRALSEHYDIGFEGEPDILFYSVFGGKIPTTKAVLVYYTGEAVAPDLENSDWSFSFDYDEILGVPTHQRLPLYVLSTNVREFQSDWARRLVKSGEPATEAHASDREHFCAYVAYYDGFVRCTLFDKINKLKPVTAPGRSRNNADPIANEDTERSRRSRDWQEEKRLYLQNFRFTIVCENSSYPGYTSEKLVDAMMAGCIPIYWGNPEIARDFNPESFIDVGAFERAEASKVPAWIRNRPALYRPVWRGWVMPRAVQRVAHRVIEIENDNQLYQQIAKQPWFHDNHPTPYFDYERFRSRMLEISKSALERRTKAEG